MGLSLTAVQNQGGTVPGVFRVIVGTSTVSTQALGNTFGTLETWTTRSNGRSANAETEFLGDRYCWVGNNIYKFDGTNWNSVHTLSPGMDSGETGCHTGLHVININNTPCLFGFYTKTTGNTGYRVKFDGTTWTEVDLVVADHLLAPPRDLVWRNILYIFGSWASSGKCGDFNVNPLNDTWGKIDSTASITGQKMNSSPSQDAVIWKNRLFKIGVNPDITPNPGFAVYERLGSYYQKAINFTYSPFSLDPAAPLLFHDPVTDAMYSFTWVNTGGSNVGFEVHKITMDGSGNLVNSSDLGNPILPSGLRVGNASSLPSNGRSWGVFQDQITSPGGTVNTYLFYADDYSSGQPWTLYKFNGDAAQVTLIGTFGSAGMVLPQVKRGGGNRAYRPGQNTIDEIKLEAISTGLRISYRAYGGNQMNVRFFWSNDGQEPRNPCTLANTSQGTISGGSLLQDINADGLLKTVEWPFAADGVSVDDFVDVVGYIFP